VSLFEVLYDEEVVSEDAFRQWYYNEDSTEHPGKGIARASAARFYKWLESIPPDDT
jgi:translation initiation factor 4G